MTQETPKTVIRLPSDYEKAPSKERLPLVIIESPRDSKIPHIDVLGKAPDSRHQ